MSAAGPVNDRLCTGTTRSKAWLEIFQVSSHADATITPTPMAPNPPQKRTCWRRAQTSAATSHTAPNSSAPPRLTPVSASRSRAAPPSTVHQPAIVVRSGDSSPDSADCAVTANTRPDSSARRLPCAASTSSRLEQPRASTMPTPNIAPPISAPDRLPRWLSWREVLTSSQPSWMKPCVSSTAVEKVNSQTVSLPSRVPRPNSITAERMQKRERCAKKPNSSPTTVPASVTVHISPSRAISASITAASVMPISDLTDIRRR